jgi:kynurenine formamidase
MSLPFRVLDCTQLLDSSSSYLPGGQRLLRCQFNSHKRNGFANEVWTFGCDQGTHTDSPAHFIADGVTIDHMPPSRFFKPGIVLDVSERCLDAEARDGEFELTLDEMKAMLPRGKDGSMSVTDHVVCLRTGWSRRFQNCANYRGARDGVGMTGPGFSEVAAKWLMSSGAAGIGVDTFSPDVGSSTTWPVHHAVLGAGGFILENLVLEEVPSSGFHFLSLPLKLEGAPESPTRVVALIPKDQLQGIPRFSGSTVIDLTHTLSERIPTFPGAKSLITFPTASVPKEGYAKRIFCCGSDIGTHIDSPMHFFESGRSITDLKVEGELVAPGVLMDMRHCSDEDWCLSVEDVVKWESVNGKVTSGSFVLLRTGWGKRFQDEKEYRNTDSDGKMHFPGFGAEAAKFLRYERGVVGIGIDTLSLDRGIDSEYPVHQIMLGKGDDGSEGTFQVENLNFDECSETTPVVGFVFAALPIRIAGAQEALCRCVAIYFD